MSREPIAPICSFSSSSAGRGGRNPPSHQTSFSGGISTREAACASDVVRWALCFGGSAGARGKVIGDHRRERIRLSVNSRRTGLDADGMTQLERAKDRVERMAADVSKRASAEIPPTAPFERRIGGVIRLFGRRPGQRSHARVSGTDGASAGRVTPWGQYSLRRPFEGRSVQMWASRMGPRTPLQTISQRRRVPSRLVPGCPFGCQFFSRANVATCRASDTECVSGFSQ